MKTFMFMIDMLAFMMPAFALDAILFNYFIHWVW